MRKNSCSPRAYLSLGRAAFKQLELGDSGIFIGDEPRGAPEEILKGYDYGRYFKRKHV